MNAAAKVCVAYPRPLRLHSHATQEVMHCFPDVRIAYGESDEYSFVLHKHTTLFGGCALSLPTSNILTVIVPQIDAAASSCHYLYPYLLQRTYDCGARALRRSHCKPPQVLMAAVCSIPLILHCATTWHGGRWTPISTTRYALSMDNMHAARKTPVSLQYNTCFWLLVKSGVSKQEATKILQVCLRCCLNSSVHWVCTQGTVTEQKNELMYSKFGVNYNDLPQQFRKVSALQCSSVMRSPMVDTGQCAGVAVGGGAQDDEQRKCG